MQTLSTGPTRASSVVFIKCRKCGAERRSRTPLIAELCSRRDREIRCVFCMSLLGLWSSSTGGV